jgi:tetratricopeptide (TPR) repeat protein
MSTSPPRSSADVPGRAPDAAAGADAVAGANPAGAPREAGERATPGASHASVDVRAARARELLRAGHYEAAEAAYRDALAIAPDHPGLLHNLGALALRRGDAAIALQCFERCRRRQPGSSAAHVDVARALLALRRSNDAVAAARHAATIEPGSATAFNVLGLALEAAGDIGGAEAALRRSLSLDPRSVPALSNLCDLLVRAGRTSDAVRVLDALPLQDDPGVLFKRGYIAACRDDLDAAAAFMQRVADAVPDHAPARLNLGTFAQWRHDVPAAIAHFRRALDLAPGDPVALGNLAHALLYAGEHDEGWATYETRPLGVRHAEAARAHPRWGPRWNGAPLEGGTLMLHGEGGFGDVIQFCRYAPAAARRGAAAVLRLEHKYASLARLLGTLQGVRVITQDEAGATARAHASLSSLPFLLRDDPGAAGPVPYLACDPALRARWQARIAGGPGLRVGLAWGGGKADAGVYGALVDRRRSIAFDALAPLLALPGIRWVSLQVGEHAHEAASAVAAGSLVDVTRELRDFADTAALASALDLVVSVDTSVAHLSAALGIPTWLLNRYDSCWRWGVDGTTTHWYPAMRLFRQPAFGDWRSVVRDVSHALAQRVAGRNP